MPHEDCCYALERENKTLIEKYAVSQKREVMLRHALEVVVDKPKSHEAVRVATHALAATADLDGLILCEKKPVARKISYGSLVFLEGYAELSEGTSLYRAWEPK